MSLEHQPAQLVEQRGFRFHAVRFVAQFADAVDGVLDHRGRARLGMLRGQVQGVRELPHAGFGVGGQRARRRSTVDQSLRQQLFERHLHQPGRKRGVVVQPQAFGLDIQALTQLRHQSALGVGDGPLIRSGSSRSARSSRSAILRYTSVCVTALGASVPTLTPSVSRLRRVSSGASGT
ncbi:hypothetical protein [Ralstonia solanacearum]|uniref:hypothetical protein n=1 Tax=Ralstonia solanacearum TaxID=305 RepID=UPI001FFD8C6A|nr:hypothetical protein [Ralstonia solanacearum]